MSALRRVRISIGLCAFLCILPSCHLADIIAPGACDCGWKKTNRIVGGTKTGVNEFPMAAALLDGNKKLFCGATLIADRYALTAAHCIVGKTAASTTLLVGDYDLSTGSDTNAAVQHKVQTFIINQSFNLALQQNDIGLVKTIKAIAFSARVGPACLPFKFTKTDLSKRTVTALGWGATNPGGPVANIIFQVGLGVISQPECLAKFPNKIGPSQICTFAQRKDTCQKDDGGPLLYNDPATGRLFVVGVIGLSSSLCATASPKINTRVTPFLSWIAGQSRDTTYCVK